MSVPFSSATSWREALAAAFTFIRTLNRDHLHAWERKTFAPLLEGHGELESAALFADAAPEVIAAIFDLTEELREYVQPDHVETKPAHLTPAEWELAYLAEQIRILEERPEVRQLVRRLVVSETERDRLHRDTAEFHQRVHSAEKSARDAIRLWADRNAALQAQLAAKKERRKPRARQAEYRSLFDDLADTIAAPLPRPALAVAV